MSDKKITIIEAVGTEKNWMGAYCILEGVAKVGRGLLEGSCIVYLWRGGLIVFFEIFLRVIFM